MPISNGFSQDLNPNYYVRKPGKIEVLDEAIYYKRNEPFERPVQVINRPVIKDTVFMPDRRAPPVIPARDAYVVSPEPLPPPPPPPQMVYTTAAVTDQMPTGSFSLLPALGLNADCPCWAWLCIIFSFILLLALIGMCLYFILERDGHV